ncbi:MAG: serine protease, partial [Acetobacteraceae bacterium]|nr:serine protease [Acetobacteraceae bacterium]
MHSETNDPLTQLSASLAARVTAATPLIAGLVTRRGEPHGALLWRKDVIIASEQSLSSRDEFQAILPGGSRTAARLAGRDPGTNIAVLRLGTAEPGEGSPAASTAEAGSLVVALGIDAHGSATSRLALVHRLGPAWHSQAGGRIDQLIVLDTRLRWREEGGPVIGAGGALLGMSTLGPRGRVLVIPHATIARVVPQLLAHGRVARGWLGVGLQPVCLPAELKASTGREVGLMVISLAAGGPAASAGVIQGDILLDVGGCAVTDRSALAAPLDESRVGQPVSVRLLRAG